MTTDSRPLGQRIVDTFYEQMPSLSRPITGRTSSCDRRAAR